MAKGDHTRAENALKTQGNTMQTNMDNTRGQLENTQRGMTNTYNQGSQANLDTYGNVMGKYNSLYENPFGTNPDGSGGGLGSGGGGMPDYGMQRGIYSDLAQNGGGYGWDPMFRGAFDKAIGGYGNFADTGGFSDQNIQDIRARSLAPLRATYGNAQNDLDRSRSLTGGGANYAAAKAKMSRELGYGLADAGTNAEAQIAQMVQQGKLAGLQGLTSAGTAGQGLSTDIDSLNAQMKLAGLTGMTGIDDRLGAQASAAGARSDANAQDMFKARMGILGGMQDMYGTNPALLNVSGNQLLNSDQNLLTGQQLQNQIGIGMINGTQNLANIPGNFQGTMQDVGNFARNLGGMVSPFMGGFGNLGGSSAPNNPTVSQMGGYSVNLPGMGGSNGIMMMPGNNYNNPNLMY